MLEYETIESTGQKYYLKGKNPELLIAAGTHGDEGDVVPATEAAVKKHYDQLPNFLFIPNVSPSALELGTHENKEGANVNRSFFEGTTVEEAIQMMRLWSRFYFELFVTFHEDSEKKGFFLYDGTLKENATGRHLERTKRLRLLREDIVSFGVPLYNGIDETEDPTLGYVVKNGYVHWPMRTNDHASDYWLLVDTGRAKQVINPEIPGLISREKKAQIVDAIFRRLLLRT